MVAFRLEIDLENDAFFGEVRHEELTRILREIASDLEENGGLRNSNIRDINGNLCGEAKFVTKRKIRERHGKA